jgi:flagellar FliL protein
LIAPSHPGAFAKNISNLFFSDTMATSTPTAPATTPARSPKLLIGALLAISLCAVAVAAYAVFNTRSSAPEPAKTVQQEKPIFVTLEPFTVNMQAEGRGRFLHVGMALKVRDEQAKAQIVEFMPELRSRALLLLSNRQPDSLLTTEDKTKLAEEIRTELNRPLSAALPPQGIVSVSFNTFVVQ